jgi:hypothetical protein
VLSIAPSGLGFVEFGGDSVVAAAAILDRFRDGAAAINVKGPSWRPREHRALAQPLSSLVDGADHRPARTP